LNTLVNFESAQTSQSDQFSVGVNKQVIQNLQAQAELWGVPVDVLIYEAA